LERKELEDDFDIDNPYRKGTPLYNNSYDYEDNPVYNARGDTSSDQEIDDIDIPKEVNKIASKRWNKPKILSHYSSNIEHA
jgi:hypothetical protein